MTGELCRICLDAKNVLHLFYFQDDHKNIRNKIMQISNVKVKISENDTLTSHFCNNCIQKIDDFYEFKCLIERSDIFLRSISQQSDLPSNAKSNEVNQQIKVENELVLENSNEIDKNSKLLLYHSHENSTSDDERFTKNTEMQNSNNLIKGTTTKPKFQCYLCGVLLSTNHSLKKHIRTHTGEKPFDCVICKKSFTSAFNLKIHSRTHTGEKPLNCPLCPMKFAQPASLVAHQRNHTGELPYKCHLCLRTFKSNSSLKYHIVTHTGEKKFSCSICKRSFITKGDVKNHEKTHSDEKPFICPICGLRLRRAYGLKRHIQGHNGIKNHKCDLCNVAFLQKYDLKRHRTTHLKLKIDKIS